jgi:hypothetical protein
MFDQQSRTSQMVPTRRFRVIDAILLVATLALAMGIHRAYWASFGFDPMEKGRFPATLASELIGVTTLYSLTIAAMLVLVQCLPPRRPRVELANLPGFMACLTLLCVAAAVAALSPLIEHVEWKGATPQKFLAVRAVARCFTVGGVAVAACWVSLAFGGNSKPEPKWTDRLGRAVGAWVILSYPSRILVLLAVTPPGSITPIVPQ